MVNTGYVDPMDLDFEDCYPSLAALSGGSPFRVAKWKEAQRRYRAFADRHMRPIALEIDAKSREDHDYLAWDFCRAAADERLFSTIVPPMFGGQGGDVLDLAIMLEEFCAACTGLANIIGAHYLGFAGLAAGMNLEVIGRVSDDIIAGEKRGEPIIMSAAHTEPSAGSDVEDEHAMHTARVTCSAKKVDGGWLINGQKVFISNGHFATWHFLSAYEDTKDPLGTGVGAIAHSNDPGFSLAKHEHKMGQRATPASVLVFEDCFVPDDRAMTMDNLEAGFFERVLFVLGTSRIGVGAICTGCARGAYETAIKVAKTEKFKGRFLIDEQWVQQMLADMLANVMIGRALYINAAFCEERGGMMSLISNPVLDWWQKLSPNFMLRSTAIQKTARSGVMSKIMNKALSATDLRSRQRGQGHSSTAKWIAADLAMQNANLALEITGAAGLEQASGVEKYFRDAKLLQIYEGTNQINRKHLWDSMIARNTTM